MLSERANRKPFLKQPGRVRHNSKQRNERLTISFQIVNAEGIEPNHMPTFQGSESIEHCGVKAFKKAEQAEMYQEVRGEREVSKLDV